MIAMTGGHKTAPVSTCVQRARPTGGLPATPSIQNRMKASIASNANGVATLISYHDADEVFARASLVRNTVEPNPEEPTLTEVREMIEEVMAEEPLEEEKDL